MWLFYQISCVNVCDCFIKSFVLMCVIVWSNQFCLCVCLFYQISCVNVCDCFIKSVVLMWVIVLSNQFCLCVGFLCLIVRGRFGWGGYCRMFPTYVVLNECLDYGTSTWLCSYMFNHYLYLPEPLFWRWTVSVWWKVFRLK